MTGTKILNNNKLQSHLGQSGSSQVSHTKDFTVDSYSNGSFVWQDLNAKRNTCQVLAIAQMES